jgi:hypothetical protein
MVSMTKKWVQMSQVQMICRRKNRRRLPDFLSSATRGANEDSLIQLKTFVVQSN